MDLPRRPMLLLALVLLSACSAPQAPRARAPARAVDWFPLAAGAAWSFDVDTGLGGGTVLATLAVQRADPPRYFVRSGTHTETYELRPDGVVREGEYLLRDPIREGATWEGREGARYEIRATGQRREGPAGRFDGVIEVVRRSSGTGLTTTTWYAPRVGVVEILAEAESSRGTRIHVRSSLRGYTLGGE